MKPYKQLRWPRFWPFLRVVDELPATKRGRRKASNCGVSIVIRRDVLRGEPWVLQQEIYESRYWLRHPWRLVDFYWFYQYLSGYRWEHRNEGRWKKAAAHLSRVECASRAQEIRARVDESLGSMREKQDRSDWRAREYARSIHGAKNYPFLKAAGWTEEDVYNEIVRHL